MKKFEYCYIGVEIINNLSVVETLTLPNNNVVALSSRNLSDLLNDLGNDNWEMVGCGVAYGYNSQIIYFKREKSGN